MDSCGAAEEEMECKRGRSTARPPLVCEIEKSDYLDGANVISRPTHIILAVLVHPGQLPGIDGGFALASCLVYALGLQAYVIFKRLLNPTEPIHPGSSMMPAC